MANQKHLDLLKQGVKKWNTWSYEHVEIKFDLSGADLSRANLSEAFLNRADLSKANLSGVDLTLARLSDAILSGADLSRANLSKADLNRADLSKANLSKADLSGAYLSGAILKEADLSGADLSRANLSKADLTKVDLSDAKLIETNLRQANLFGATLLGTNLVNATLVDCLVYGISAWDIQLDGATQLNLLITHPDQPAITVDNLEVAQLIYLLLNNRKIRDVIDTITSKVVLILGRFTSERKEVLDAIKEELRKQGYTPVLFDFEKPASRDITETISTLAHLSRFIIADLTSPQGIPQELAMIVPDLPSVPVQPLIESVKAESGVFLHFKGYPWVLPVYRYQNAEELISSMKEKIIFPLEAKLEELKKIRSS